MTEEVTDKVLLSECIKSYMSENGVTQSALADKIGVHQTMIGDYISDSKIPRADRFALLVEILGVDVKHIAFPDTSKKDLVTA